MHSTNSLGDRPTVSLAGGSKAENGPALGSTVFSGTRPKHKHKVLYRCKVVLLYFIFYHISLFLDFFSLPSFFFSLSFFFKDSRHGAWSMLSRTERARKLIFNSALTILSSAQTWQKRFLLAHLFIDVCS